MAAGAERQIAEEIARAGGASLAKLGLRFDRVVIRVLGDLRRFAERATPAGSAVLVAITAPIRLPAKTVAAIEPEIEALIASGAAGRDVSATLCGNEVRLRLVARSPARAEKLVGFVHNRDVDATQLLDLAEAWLRL